jgi:hypothetical protein
MRYRIPQIGHQYRSRPSIARSIGTMWPHGPVMAIRFSLSKTAEQGRCTEPVIESQSNLPTYPPNDQAMETHKDNDRAALGGCSSAAPCSAIWRPTSSGLPAYYEAVLCFVDCQHDGIYMRIGMLHRARDQYQDDHWMTVECSPMPEPTHWMPLPHWPNAAHERRLEKGQEHA